LAKFKGWTKFCECRVEYDCDDVEVKTEVIFDFDASKIDTRGYDVVDKAIQAQGLLRSRELEFVLVQNPADETKKLLQILSNVKEGCGDIYIEIDSSNTQIDDASDFSFKIEVALSFIQANGVPTRSGGVLGAMSTSPCEVTCGSTRPFSSYLVKGACFCLIELFKEPSLHLM
jgi:hypothetical protein